MPTNKYDLAAALEIAGLNDGKYHRLTAVEQRAVFGFAVAGKREFKVNLLNQGQVQTRWTTPACYSTTDTLFAAYSLATVADAVNTSRKLADYPGEMPA